MTAASHGPMPLDPTGSGGIIYFSGLSSGNSLNQFFAKFLQCFCGRLSVLLKLVHQLRDAIHHAAAGSIALNGI